MHLSLSRLDTTPGAGQWTAPDAEVADYAAWMRGRYRADPVVPQLLWLAARSMDSLDIQIDGPYAEDLRRILMEMAVRKPVTPAQTPSSQGRSRAR